MTGVVAPVLWAEGRREEVLGYVAQDVRIALGLATACEACGGFRWIARSGKLLSMASAEKLPQPDTSWMDEPWWRTKFTGWMR